MLEAASKLARERNLNNVIFQRGKNMRPFSASSFPFPRPPPWFPIAPPPPPPSPHHYLSLIAHLPHLLSGQAEDIKFESNTFDIVVCRIAPHHFRNVPLFVSECARVLKPGGRLVIEDSMSPEDREVAAFLENLEWERDNTHVHSYEGGWPRIGRT